MSQHTPGPWESMGFYISARNESLRLPNAQTIARVFPEHETVGGNTLANARLIASAPELLSALNAIVARIQGDWDHPDLVRYGPLQLASHDCLEIARNAIAKAEGRAE